MDIVRAATRVSHLSMSLHRKIERMRSISSCVHVFVWWSSRGEWVFSSERVAATIVRPDLWPISRSPSSPWQATPSGEIMHSSARMYSWERVDLICMAAYYKNVATASSNCCSTVPVVRATSTYQLCLGQVQFPVRCVNGIFSGQGRLPHAAFAGPIKLNLRVLMVESKMRAHIM